MIKAIFLDLHGVVSAEGHIILHYFAPIWSELSVEQIIERYRKARIMKKGGFEVVTEGLAKEKIFAYTPKIKFYKGAEETLKALYKKHPLFIASDHVEKFFEKEFDTLRIKKYFKKNFVSYKMGISKKDKAFYETLLKETGYKANECVFVDDTQRNVELAKEVGFYGVWVETGIENRHNKPDYNAEFMIKDLRELLPIIEKLEKR